MRKRIVLSTEKNYFEHEEPFTEYTVVIEHKPIVLLPTTHSRTMFTFQELSTSFQRFLLTSQEYVTASMGISIVQCL